MYVHPLNSLYLDGIGKAYTSLLLVQSAGEQGNVQRVSFTANETVAGKVYAACSVIEGWYHIAYTTVPTCIM